MPVFRYYALHFAWMISFIATGVSLYMSEVLRWEPCTLCWIQRIFMFPLVIILGIAVYNNDRNIVRYTVPLTIIGGAVSMYHYLLQMVSALKNIQPCHTGVPCHSRYIEGSLTIPLLTFITFLLITVLLIVARKNKL